MEIRQVVKDYRLAYDAAKLGLLMYHNKCTSEYAIDVLVTWVPTKGSLELGRYYIRLEE